jgi:hypothetical protein
VVHAAMCETLKVSEGALYSFMCYPTGVKVSDSPDVVSKIYNQECIYSTDFIDGDPQSFVDGLTTMYNNLEVDCKVLLEKKIGRGF